MRRALLIFVIFFLYASSILPQWTRQTSPTTKTLRNIDAVNSNVVWICGLDGTVLRTRDGGKTWLQTAVTDAAYENIAVQALDANTAWVTGTKTDTLGAKIWKTINGGDTWIELWSEPFASCNGMKFFDSKNAVAFFDYNKPSTEWLILTTSDGGANWNKVPKLYIPPLDVKNGESGLENSMVTYGNHVWFEAYSQKESRIYHSTNKGRNWSRTMPLVPTAVARCLYVVPITDTILVALGGDGWPGFSADCGKTWEFPKLQSIGLFATSAAILPDTNLIISVGLQGQSMTSTNGGRTWTRIHHTSEAKNLRSVAAYSKEHIWCAGNNGYIYKWTGPATYVNIDNPIPSDFILYQNYPNPFNPSTSIKYKLPVESNVKISIYNALGQTVSDVVNQVQTAGSYEINWEAQNSSSGIYFCEIKALPLTGEKEFNAIKKMMVIK